MIKLQTIAALELSNICTLSCKYCVNRFIIDTPSRYQGIMQDDVFDAACSVIKQTVKNGTQKEVWMNGIGESFLDKQLFKRIAIIRSIIGKDRFLGMSTNATLISKNNIDAICDCGLSQLDISLHSPEAVRKALPLLKNKKIKVLLTKGAVEPSHNWCGQLEPENEIELNDKIKSDCPLVVEGRGYVSVEGIITPCCFDYRNLGAYGTVFASDIFDKEIKHFELCKTCHLTISSKYYIM